LKIVAAARRAPGPGKSANPSRDFTGGPPGIALKPKTNLRSALESTETCKNEPETNLNEPEAAAPAVVQVL
jgi:hypothetical protein